MGGLLSIYDLSEDHVFLEKAAALTSKLMPAFEGGGEPLICLACVFCAD